MHNESASIIARVQARAYHAPVIATIRAVRASAQRKGAQIAVGAGDQGTSRVYGELRERDVLVVVRLRQFAGERADGGCRLSAELLLPEARGAVAPAHYYIRGWAADVRHERDVAVPAQLCAGRSAVLDLEPRNGRRRRRQRAVAGG